MNLRREAVNALWRLFPRSTTVRIAGRRFRLPLQRGFDRRLLNTEREPWVDPILKETCADPGAVLIDVGANCGQTLVRAKALQPDLRYLGFEPNPACAGYVQQLIALNRLTDALVYSCALGAGSDVAELFTANPSDPSATLVPNFRGVATGPLALPVVIVSGDDMVARAHLTRVDLIKIDVEGAEAQVFKGLAQTIERYRPAILCEVLSSHTPAHPSHELRQQSKQEICARLVELDYRIFGLNGGGRAAVEELSESYRNYLFLPARATMRSTSAVVERPGAKRSERT